MIATLAILRGSLRELRARKLFWVALIISALIVLGYGSIGFTEDGYFIGYGLWSFDSELMNSGSPLAPVLMEGIFSYFIVGLWLSWGAVILALLSTASTFPDLMEEGTVDLLLSKPVSRTSLFLTRYVGSMLFVAVQVLLFCIGVFLVIGFRLEEWRWMVFAAVPAIVLMYSYLYGFMTLMATVTRSPLAALLFTMLLWFTIFSVHVGDGQLGSMHRYAQDDYDFSSSQVETLETRIEAAREAGRPTEDLEERLEDLREEADADARTLASWTWWRNAMRACYHVFPKNDATIDLLARSLEADRDKTLFDLIQDQQRKEMRSRIRDEDRLSEIEKEMEAEAAALKEARDRSPAYIIGTSLAFEAVCVLLAVWLFRRRDF